MKKLFLILGYFIVFASLGSIAFAGGWSSGGGGLLKDSVNPWFLPNTTHVSFCLRIDEKAFGTNEETARRQVTRAIQFWKQQFDDAISPTLPKFGEVKIASQVFTERSCEDSVDIVFQFGVLSKKQIKYLKDPREYAAISVRTAYDEVNLRGKGFVYVSPSHGPLAYNHEGAVKHAWDLNAGHLLYLTLIHELGHVFGLQHMGSLGDLMSEGFVELILASAATSMSNVQTEINFFSLRTGSPMICPAVILLKAWQNFFGAPSSAQCFLFEFVHPPDNILFGTTLMRVHTAESQSAPKKQIQQINLAMNRFYPSFVSLIWLPKAQAVFEDTDLLGAIGSRISGTSGLGVGKQGRFILPKQKTERVISVRFEQGKGTFFIDGVVDGKLITLL